MSGNAFKPIDDKDLIKALNGITRAINLLSAYGEQHPAFIHAAEAAHEEIKPYFENHKKVIIGTFNGIMAIDEVPVTTEGPLIKSLEKRLAKLQITGLRISSNISEKELQQLIILLSSSEADQFEQQFSSANLSNITSEDMQFAAVHGGETVGDVGAFNGGGDGEGMLVLDDEFEEFENEGHGGGDGASVHVDQIVAFLKGEIDSDDEEVGKELEELASDPDKLGKMIMESVAIRQSVSELSGESLSDVILGCLRKTYDGLKKRPAFKTPDGMADLKKALLLLEESVLDRMRDITGESDEELDRQIVQTIREMDDSLGVEMAAGTYMQGNEAMQASREEIEAYVRTNGIDKAKDLLSDTDFPNQEWRKIVVNSGAPASSALPVAAGLDTLVNVLEKLEGLMESGETADGQVSHLINQASSSLDSSTSSTDEKLELLSQVLQEESGTIGGEGKEMSLNELLTTLAEISQELMQPLTAMNVSIEMLMGGFAGEVTEEQNDMLQLASSSGDNLKYLMRRLIDIVGLPVSKSVDTRFATPHETLHPASKED